MSTPAATEVPVEIECTKQEYRAILTACKAAIFRDIWRLTDADVALKMFFTLQRALPDNLDRSGTLKLDTLSARLREVPDPIRYLEFSIRASAFDELRFSDEYNRRAAERRAAKAAEETAKSKKEETTC